MKYRKAVFIVTYAKERHRHTPNQVGLKEDFNKKSLQRAKNKISYLILKRKLHWKGWEFPKGGINFLEGKRKAVKREVKEETGLEILKIKKFNINGKYKYDKKYPDRPKIIGQTFSLYAVEVKKGKVKIDKKEHSDYKWLEFEKAIKKLTWPNQKKCIEVVNRELKK